MATAKTKAKAKDQALGKHPGRPASTYPLQECDSGIWDHYGDWDRTKQSVQKTN